MTTWDKIKITLLTIFTLGFIWIWINKKPTIKSELTVEKKVKVNIELIIKSIGLKNIVEITNTQQRVKIIFNDNQKVDKETLKKLKGISGMMLTSTSVSLIVGKSAAEVAKQLKNKK